MFVFFIIFKHGSVLLVRGTILSLPWAHFLPAALRINLQRVLSQGTTRLKLCRLFHFGLPPYTRFLCEVNGTRGRFLIKVDLPLGEQPYF